jgi:hypothetical protein
MIVDSAAQYSNYKTQITNQHIVCCAITLHPQKHLIDNTIVGWYIKIIQGPEFTIFIEHPEALLKDDAFKTFDKAERCYIVDFDTLAYAGYKPLPNMEDALINSYLSYGTIPEQEYNPQINFYRKRVGSACSNFLVDPMKIQQHYRELVDRLPIDKDNTNKFYQAVKRVYHTIEKNGIAINEPLYKEAFGDSGYVKNGKAYTKYNLYTSTGRPSNRFAGVNYAALNKEDGTRECFVSRYPNGKLVEIDFTSYHPRILASITKYVISDEENIYEHLAKEYFGDNPTQDQISQAKEMTFRQLYGGINRQYLHIEYFARIQMMTDMLWNLYKQQGYVTSIISKRKIHNIEDASPTKVLNYFIQLHETEQNVQLLAQLFAELPQDVLPVLYTYDSILFDVPQGKENQLLDTIRAIIPSKFPFKVKIGDNYSHID